jgi:proteasome lid subunit RPN8/RPN11
MRGSRRVDAKEPLSHVSIPARTLNALCQHALECAAVAEECCGLVVADGEERFGRVVHCRNVMTLKHAEDPGAWPRDNRNGYFMHPEDLREWLEPGSAGCVSAVYHSHLGVDAYLSSEDLAYVRNDLFPFPRADQIVLSVNGKRVEPRRLFRRSSRDAEFVAMTLSAEHA